MRRILSMLAALVAVALVSVTLAGSVLAGRPVYVRAEVPWNFGGLPVTDGVTYDVHATGLIHTAKIPYFHDPGVSMSANGPGGQSHAQCLADYETFLDGTCAIVDANFGALIGVVIDGDTGLPTAPPFVIGAEPSFVAPADGWLFLGVNDLSLSHYDNSGQFTVTITPQ